MNWQPAVSAIGNYIAKEFPGGKLSMVPVPGSDRMRFVLEYGTLRSTCEVSLDILKWAVETTSSTREFSDELLSEMREHLPIYRAVDAVTGDIIWRGTRPERYLGPSPTQAVFMERMGPDGRFTPFGNAVSPRKVTRDPSVYAAPQTHTHAAPDAVQGSLKEIQEWLKTHNPGALRSTEAARHSARDAEEARKKREQEAELVRERQRAEAEKREAEDRARREMARLAEERRARIRRGATGAFEPIDVMIAEIRNVLGNAAEKEAELRDKQDEDALFGTASTSVQKEILWADARKKLAELQAFVNERVAELDERIEGRLSTTTREDEVFDRALAQQQERNAPEYTPLEAVPIEGPVVGAERAQSDLDDFLDVLG